MLNRYSQLLLLLCSSHAVSVSLSHYERITDVPSACFAIWNKDISECRRRDFSGNGCSLLCFEGLVVIDAEVRAACTKVDAGNDTLLGKFLAGDGPSTMCAGDADAEKTSTPEPTSQTTEAPHHETKTHTFPQTKTTEPASVGTAQLTMSDLPGSFSSSTTSTTSASSAGPSTTAGSPTTTGTADSTTTTASQTSATSNPDAKGFGGVGDAYDILGGHSDAGRLETPWLNLVVAALCAVSMGSVVWQG